MNYQIGLIIESFETGDFSAYKWQQGGDTNWIIVTNNPIDSSYCAQSGEITNNQTSEIELHFNNVTAGQTLSFYYKVSSEKGYDYLRFYVNETKINEWSGEIPWTKMNYQFTSSGDYTIKFAYEKDPIITEGNDCAWLDYIKLPIVPVKTNLSTKSISITAPVLPKLDNINRSWRRHSSSIWNLSFN